MYWREGTLAPMRSSLAHPEGFLHGGLKGGNGFQNIFLAQVSVAHDEMRSGITRLELEEFVSSLECLVKRLGLQRQLGESHMRFGEVRANLRTSVNAVLAAKGSLLCEIGNPQVIIGWRQRRRSLHDILQCLNGLLSSGPGASAE